MRKNKNARKRVMALLMLAVLVLSLLGGIAPAFAANSEGDIKYIADKTNVDGYKDMLGNAGMGNLMAGRVWSDKSVFTHDAVTSVKLDGKEVKFDDEFLVVFSAMGSKTKIIDNTADSSAGGGEYGGIDDSGLSYKDPVGRYMEIKSIKHVVLNGQLYDVVKSVSGAEYSVYGLDGVKIFVQETNGYQTLIVNVDTKTLPVRTETVTVTDRDIKYESDGNKITPVRVVYTIGPRNDIKTDGQPDHRRFDDGYIANNKYSVSGKDYVNLYASTFAADLGDALVTFKPLSSNPYYFFQKNTAIYTKVISNVGLQTNLETTVANPVTGTKAITDNLDQKFYIVANGYAATGSGTDGKSIKYVTEVTGAQLADYAKKSGSYVILKSGVMRVDVLNTGVVDTDKITNTSKYESYDAITNGTVTTALGDNGAIVLLYAEKADTGNGNTGSNAGSNTDANTGNGDSNTGSNTNNGDTGNNNNAGNNTGNGNSGNSVLPPPVTGEIAISMTHQVGNTAANTGDLRVNSGDIVEYVITVANNTNTDAANLKVTATIPAGITIYNNSIVSNGTINGRTITWMLTNVPAGQSQVLGYKIIVPNLAGATTWRTSATATTSSQSVTSNTLVMTNTTTASLAVEKTQALNSNPATNEQIDVLTNDMITYTITVTNRGQQTAENIVIKDVIPGGLLFQYDSVKDNASSLMGSTVKVSYAKSTGTLTFKIDKLAPGASYVVHFTVIVPAAPDGTYWDNQAVVTYENNPDNKNGVLAEIFSNPVRSVKVPAGKPELSLVMTQAADGGAETGKEIIVDGESVIVYRVRVANVGPVDAEGVYVTSAVPGGLILDAATISHNGSATSLAAATTAADTVVWNLGTLVAGGSVTVEYRVSVPQMEGNTEWINVANATASNADSVSSNKVKASQYVQVKAEPQTGVDDPIKLVLAIVFGAGLIACVALCYVTHARHKTGRVARGSRK